MYSVALSNFVREESDAGALILVTEESIWWDIKAYEVDVGKRFIAAVCMSCEWASKAQNKF